ncbi:unnamed protein product [Owenia fusiformis]|uniref:glutathione transferase n=1 Tax=Owenia fusiformis TaxID=6347 RepID=A0A8S4Q5C6_OWEFU|nr:unnamed protein product [Owenia fusiformis]
MVETFRSEGQTGGQSSLTKINMVLRVYYDLMSQPCRAIVMFLKLNHIPYEDKIVALRKGEHFEEPFTKLNPFQRVPVIDDDGFVLTESVSILKYLCRKYKLADHWYPQELKKQARCDEYLNWQHWNTRMNAAMVFRTIAIDTRMTGKPVDTEKLKMHRHQLETTLDFLENVYLKRGRFLTGDEISIADILGVCELMQPYIIGQDVRDNRPRLKQWMNGTIERLQPHFDDTHKVIMKAREKYLKSQAKL